MFFSKLKIGRAPGLDNVTIYMIKCGQTDILQFFINGCFTFGHYLKLWSSGYITPIHKFKVMLIIEALLLQMQLLKICMFGLVIFRKSIKLLMAVRLDLLENQNVSEHMIF